MLEKIGHVKNPLTVVALFAGIAEVSGTVVLPLLEKDIQHTFVWFLMGFPTLLVGVFFAILHWNHTVLYAPSDFQDEQNFTGLVKASVQAIAIKSELEAVDALVDPADPPPADEFDDDLPPLPIPSIPDSADILAGFRHHFGISVQRGRRVEEIVISKLEAERNLIFARGVSTKEDPNIVFDGVSTTLDQRVIVEVRYTTQGAYPPSRISRVFNNVRKYFSSLTPALRSKLHFILVLVVGDDTPESTARDTLAAATDMASMYQFSSEVIGYRYSELVQEDPT